MRQTEAVLASKAAGIRPPQFQTTRRTRPRRPHPPAEAPPPRTAAKSPVPRPSSALRPVHGGGLVAFPTGRLRPRRECDERRRTRAALQGERPAARSSGHRAHRNADQLERWAAKCPTRTASRRGSGRVQSRSSCGVRRRARCRDRRRRPVALRVPSHPVAQALLRAFATLYRTRARRIAAPSATVMARSARPLRSTLRPTFMPISI